MASQRHAVARRSRRVPGRVHRLRGGARNPCRALTSTDTSPIDSPRRPPSLQYLPLTPRRSLPGQMVPGQASTLPKDQAMSSHYVPHTKVPTLVYATSREATRHVALMIESLIRQNNSAGRPTVLGLPTGSTPVGLYRELIRLHREQGLDFSHVVTFNLDEYSPMEPDAPHSYNRWMHETFFDHVNTPAVNINIPDGTIPPDEVEDW